MTTQHDQMPDEIWLHIDSEKKLYATLDEIDFSTFAHWIPEAKYTRTDLHTAELAARDARERELLAVIADLADCHDQGASYEHSGRLLAERLEKHAAIITQAKAQKNV